MSVELEEMILGAVLDADGASLQSNAGALLDLAGLKPGDFTSASVCTGWKLITKLLDLRRPVDVNTVVAIGLGSRVLTTAAAEHFRLLASRNTLNKTSFGEVVEQLRRVRQREALRKQLIAALTDLDDSAKDPERIAGSLEATCQEVALGSRGADETADSDVLQLGAEWEARDAAGSILLVPTGIAAVDKEIGGWAPNLNVIAGLPSVGKSAFLATCIEEQLKLGMRVGLFGLEDGTRWLSKRIIARELGLGVRDVGTKRLDSFTPEQQARYPDVMQATMKLLKNLVVYRRDTISSSELIRKFARWVQNHGVQCGYVDHGGEVEHDTKGHDDYRLAVGDTYRLVRNSAVRYQVPWVVLAHTNRASERDDGEERPPKASDLAESAYIERRARVAIGLWRKHDEPGHMRLTVMKQTEGRAGQTIKLDRITAAALIDPNSGHEVNLFAERMAAARAAKEKRDAERKSAAEAKKSEKASSKAQKAQLAFGGDA